MSAEAERLHADALVVDGACPLLVVKEFVDWYIEGGVDIVTPTVGGFHPALVSFQLIGEWLAFINERRDLRLVTTSGEALQAKAQGATGVVFHFQGTDPIEGDLRHIDAFKRLGVGIMQLTYNTENLAGFGCMVDDEGLKPFGRDHPTLQRGTRGGRLLPHGPPNLDGGRRGVGGACHPVALQSACGLRYPI